MNRHEKETSTQLLLITITTSDVCVKLCMVFENDLFVII